MLQMYCDFVDNTEEPVQFVFVRRTLRDATLVIRKRSKIAPRSHSGVARGCYRYVAPRGGPTCCVRSNTAGFPPEAIRTQYYECVSRWSGFAWYADSTNEEQSHPARATPVYSAIVATSDDHGQADGPCHALFYGLSKSSACRQ